MSPSTASAVLITSLTTMIGFGSLMVASHRGLQSLGRVLTIGVRLLPVRLAGHASGAFSLGDPKSRFGGPGGDLASKHRPRPAYPPPAWRANPPWNQSSCNPPGESLGPGRG